jgi:hypothetical protein
MDLSAVLLELRQMIDEREAKLKAAFASLLQSHSELETLLRERISQLEDRVKELGGSEP